MNKTGAYLTGIGLGLLILMLNRKLRRDLGGNNAAPGGSGGNGTGAGSPASTDCGCGGSSQSSIPEVADPAPLSPPAVSGYPSRPRASIGVTPSAQQPSNNNTAFSFWY
jgi:hypothetical protein